MRRIRPLIGIAAGAALARTMTFEREVARGIANIERALAPT